jgi:hypothetical protein
MIIHQATEKVSDTKNLIFFDFLRKGGAKITLFADMGLQKAPFQGLDLESLFRIWG